MHYCNISCQRNDWNIHKQECMMFKGKDLKLLRDDQIRLFIRILIKYKVQLKNQLIYVNFKNGNFKG
jgi:hypothetical protein